MWLFTDIALALLCALALYCLFRACARSLGLVLVVVGPLLLALGGSAVAFVLFAMLVGPRGAGGGGHSPGETTALAWAAIGVVVFAGGWSGWWASRVTERHNWRARWAPQVTTRWVRHVRYATTLGALLLTPLLWHEHRFWRTYELAVRSLDRRANSEAVYDLGRLGDRRALALLRRLGWTRDDAVSALAGMGDGGKVVLIEYLQSQPESRRRAEVLVALCGRFARDPLVRELAASAAQAEDVDVRTIAAQRCLGVPAQ